MLAVQKLDSAIRQITHYPLDGAIIDWFLVDSAIHFLNNWGQMVWTECVLQHFEEVLVLSWFDAIALYILVFLG